MINMRMSGLFFYHELPSRIILEIIKLFKPRQIAVVFAILAQTMNIAQTLNVPNHNDLKLQFEQHFTRTQKN